MNAATNEQIESAIAAFAGRVSVYAENLDTGATYDHGADTRIQTASTIKVAIMAATHAEVAAGRAAWDDPLTLRESEKAYGAGILRELHDGLQITLRDAVNLMIVLSDNTATNLVLHRIGIDTVNDHLDLFGIPEIRSLRQIGGGYESRAYEDPENANFGIGVATPRSMVRLLAKIARREIVTPADCDEMLATLKRQQLHYGIGRHLDGDKVGNKPGALDHLRSDVGIVTTDHGWIAMAITCDQLPEVSWSVDCAAYLMIARVSELLVDGFG